MSQTLTAHNEPKPQLVSFPSGDGSVVAHLYLPEGHDPAKRYPAAVVGGSFASVKEQMGDVYAGELARRGVIALAIDYRNYGQSSGSIRQYEDPVAKAADLSAAIAFLKARPDVAGTGLLGVCTSGGNVLDAAARDGNVGAVATVAGMFTEPSLQLAMRGAEAIQARKEEGRAARRNYEQTGVIEIVRAYHDSDQTAANVAPLPYYFDAARGAVPAWRNEFAVMAWEAMLDFDPVARAAQVTAPTLIVHSEGSAFPDQARKTHALLAGPKALYWGEGSHLDFYDQADQVRDAADHVAAHFHENLG